MLITQAQAAIFVTKSTGSVSWGSSTWAVRANAYWDTNTGGYAGNGLYEVTAKPKNTLVTTYNINYHSRTSLGRLNATQYYQPAYRDIILGGLSEYGPLILVRFTSPGIM